MGLVTGTVQLSLAEVDNLRDQIKDKEVKIKELETELVGVKADKRIMKITKKVFAGKSDYRITVDPRLFTSLENHEKEEREFYVHHYRNQYHSKESKVIAALNLEPVQYGTIKESAYASFSTMSRIQSNLDEQVEFVNMDDIKELLKQDISLKYEEELRSLRDSQRYHTDNISSLRKDKDKAIEDLQEIIAEKDKAYEDLLMDKQEKSEIELYKEQVKKLSKELEKEINKPWYKKLFK